MKELTSGIETQFANTYKPIIVPLEKIVAQREGEREGDEEGVQQLLIPEGERLEMPEEREQWIRRPVERLVAHSRKRKVADASVIGSSSVFQTEKHR